MFAVTTNLRNLFPVELEDRERLTQNIKPQGQFPGAKYETMQHNLITRAD